MAMVVTMTRIAWLNGEFPSPASRLLQVLRYQGV